MCILTCSTLGRMWSTRMPHRMVFIVVLAMEPGTSKAPNAEGGPRRLCACVTFMSGVLTSARSDCRRPALSLLPYPARLTEGHAEISVLPTVGNRV